MNKPKFKVNQHVMLDGKPGIVTEVGVHDRAWFLAGHEQLYSVRMPPWKKVAVLEVGMPHPNQPGAVLKEPVYQYENPDNPGEYRGHEADTLGGVQESQIEARK